MLYECETFNEIYRFFVDMADEQKSDFLSLCFWIQWKPS